MAGNGSARHGTSEEGDALGRLLRAGWICDGTHRAAQDLGRIAAGLSARGLEATGHGVRGGSGARYMAALSDYRSNVRKWARMLKGKEWEFPTADEAVRALDNLTIDAEQRGKEARKRRANRSKGQWHELTLTWCLLVSVNGMTCGAIAETFRTSPNTVLEWVSAGLKEYAGVASPRDGWTALAA